MRHGNGPAWFALLSLFAAACGEGALVGAADFTLQLDPPSLTMAMGGSASCTVDVTRNGYSGPIAFSVKGLPPNVIATEWQSTVTLTSSADVAGSYTFTVVGRAATWTGLPYGVETTTTGHVTIDGSFSISVSPPTVEVGKVTYDVAVTRTDGFDDPVQLSLSCNGCTYSSSPNPTVGGTSTLVIPIDSKYPEAYLKFPEDLGPAKLTAEARGLTRTIDLDLPAAPPAAALVPGGPAGRVDPAMAFDASRGVTLLFGGALGILHDVGFSGETWAFDGSTWTELATSGPAPRYSAGMAYDPGRDRIVLYGGRDGSTALFDTWEWDGTAWTQVSAVQPLGTIAERGVVSMAYNASDGKTYMTQSAVFADAVYHSRSTPAPGTWTWDGTAWTQVCEVDPTPDGITYDSVRGKLIGYRSNLAYGAGSVSAVQTFDWNGSSWVQTSDDAPFSLTEEPVFVYHPVLGKTLFIDGLHPSFEDDYVKKQTWELDGAQWSWAYPAIADRAGASAAFDSVRGKLVLFGGYDNLYHLPTGTWLY